jgi:hypothetical protein
VAEAARHGDPVGAHEVLALVVAGVGVIALWVPGLGRIIVKRRIGEQPQAHDPGAIAVEGTRRQVLAARAELDARVLGCVLEGVGRAAGAALVEPQPPAVRVRPLGLLETGLVDQAEIFPTVVAAVLRELRTRRIGVGGDRLQEIEIPHALFREDVPQVVVPRGPHHPVVASDDLGGG